MEQSFHEAWRSVTLGIMGDFPLLLFGRPLDGEPRRMGKEMSGAKRNAH